MTSNTKRAADLVAGDFVAERDGAEFQVEATERRGAFVLVTLANVHGYMSANATIVARVKATSLIRVHPLEQA